MLLFQAFNTFIDDVFAFIITMPTSHRLACFRDDVVFIVYVYQRWYVLTQQFDFAFIYHDYQIGIRMIE